MSASEANEAVKAGDSLHRRLDQVVKAQASLRRRLDQYAETQQWVHHVADLDSGEVLTTTLNRPVTPISRAERLSRLGHRFDPSIFSGPAYKLTPKRPFQGSPAAHLIAAQPDAYDARDDVVVWQPPRNLGTNFVFRGIRFFFAESPHERSVVSVALSGKAFHGTLGHVRVLPSPSPVSIRFPITDVFAAHTVDVTFVPLGGRPLDVIMQIEVGIELLTFSSISFRAEPPGLDPGTFESA